jgi:hypothetical protein
MRLLCLLGGVVFLVALGCGGAAPQAERAAKKQDGKVRQGPAAGADADKEKGADKRKPALAEERKIIYTANLGVVVEDFDEAKDRFLALLKERGGYVVQSDIEGGQPGSRRTATWTVRVPAARFDSFLDEVGKLGELRHRKVDSEDVTDQYHDTTEEIKNYKLSEAALLRLYTKKIASSTLEDVLKLQAQITEVQGKINVLKGRIKRWDKLTEYSTATVVLTSRKDYAPPVEPNFGNRLSETFRASLNALIAFGKFLVLTLAALTPWLPVLAVLAGVLVLVAWLRRRRAAPTPTSPPGS